MYCPYIFDAGKTLNNWFFWIWLVGDVLGAISAAFLCEWFINEEESHDVKKMEQSCFLKIFLLLS